MRIVLVDDHAVVRGGVRLLLQAHPDLRVVAESSSASESLAVVRTHRPDIVLLDLYLQGRSGLDLIGDYLAVAPGSRVVVLSMRVDSSTVRRAFAAGASGYVPKRARDDELVAALRAVAGGELHVHPTLGAVLASAGAGADGLTEREEEVLRQLALGHTNQEIAAALTISVRTVEMHRSHVLRKLNLQTRAQLVEYALSNGLIGAG